MNHWTTSSMLSRSAPCSDAFIGRPSRRLIIDALLRFFDELDDLALLRSGRSGAAFQIQCESADAAEHAHRDAEQKENGHVHRASQRRLSSTETDRACKDGFRRKNQRER